MRPKQDQRSNSDQVHKNPAWAALVVDILNTPEVRRILTDVGVQWLWNWSGNSLLKKSAGKPAAWVLARTLSPDGRGDLAAVFANPEHIEALSREIPTIVGSIQAILCSAAQAVERLPAERKRALFSRLFAVRQTDTSSPLLASLARTAEDVYREEPHFFSSQLLPLLEHWLAQTDFGELRSFFDAAETDLESFCKQATGLLFEYPAKLIALLSILPGGINIAVSVVNDLLDHLNSLPPDIFTDLLLTLFRQVDATAIGRTLDRSNEAIRQMHTGSTLIGEMDAPRFSADLREKIREIMAQIDPVLAIKARNALIDGRETLISEMIDAAREHPELWNLWLHQLAAKRNSDIRLLKQKLQVFETMPEEDIIEALSAGLSTWNAYDLAGMVNTVGRTLNRISRVKPELFPALVTDFVNSLDRCDLEETLDNFSRELGEVIRPVFRMAAPPIIRELARFFEPGEEDDGYDDAMRESRNRLRRWMLGEETP